LSWRGVRVVSKHPLADEIVIVSLAISRPFLPLNPPSASRAAFKPSRSFWSGLPGLQIFVPPVRRGPAGVGLLVGLLVGPQFRLQGEVHDLGQDVREHAEEGEVATRGVG
jgi:hypothetical protein